eukprot:4614943-Pyramimonas_sp.AAC.1
MTPSPPPLHPFSTPSGDGAGPHPRAGGCGAAGRGGGHPISVAHVAPAVAKEGLRLHLTHGGYHLPARPPPA